MNNVFLRFHSNNVEKIVKFLHFYENTFSQICMGYITYHWQGERISIYCTYITFKKLSIHQKWKKKKIVTLEFHPVQFTEHNFFFWHFNYYTYNTSPLNDFFFFFIFISNFEQLKNKNDKIFPMKITYFFHIRKRTSTR